MYVHVGYRSVEVGVCVCVHEVCMYVHVGYRSVEVCVCVCVCVRYVCTYM